MNPYQNYLEKNAFLGRALSGANAMLHAPMMMQAGEVLSHPLTRAALTVAAPAMFAAGRGIATSIAAERTWADLKREIQRDGSVFAGMNERVLRDAFMTIAKTAPDVASNRMLALAALKQFVGTTLGDPKHPGSFDFHPGAFSTIQNMQTSMSNRGVMGSNAYHNNMKALGGFIPTQADVQGFDQRTLAIQKMEQDLSNPRNQGPNGPSGPNGFRGTGPNNLTHMPAFAPVSAVPQISLATPGGPVPRFAPRQMVGYDPLYGNIANRIGKGHAFNIQHPSVNGLRARFRP